MNGKSPDTVATLKEKLSALIPEAFAEGKIDWEKLRVVLGENINFSNERYVLNWAGKSDAFKVMQAPTTKTLVPAKDESVNFDETENIFIEGENLEVLKTLQKSYFGKVKMIYIDPPYNTGNDFVYNDKFAENKKEYLIKVGAINEDGHVINHDLYKENTKDNGQYHSNWLNMIYPRLFMAKNLLKDDGVIFVSIDDNEVHNLRLVMNEIFGEENFMSNIVWQKKYAATNDAKGFSPMHDHILVYQKSGQFERNLLPRTEEQNKPYKHDDGDGKGLWRSDNLLVKSFSESGVFPILNPNTGQEYLPPEGSCWRGNKKTIEKWLNENRIFFGKDGKGAPQLKRYLNEVQQGRVPTTWWTFQEVGHNDAANKELKALFNSKAPFDTPKPTLLIKQILKISTNKEDIVLDFFSGSGTLAHAVLDLNKKDRGNRKFICVQLPEQCKTNTEAYKAGFQTIADISKERIRRVIQKIKKEQEGQLDFSEGKQDLGFKVFKLSESNFKQWQPNPKSAEELAEQMKLFINPINGEPTNESMAFELLLKSGLNLNSTIAEKEGFYLINENELALVLEETTEEVFSAISTHSLKRVIALDTAFKGNDQLKTNAALQLKDAGIDFKTI